MQIMRCIKTPHEITQEEDIRCVGCTHVFRCLSRWEENEKRKLRNGKQRQKEEERRESEEW